MLSFFRSRKPMPTVHERVNNSLATFRATADELDALVYEANEEAAVCNDQASMFLSQAKAHYDTANTAAKASNKIRSLIS